MYVQAMFDEVWIDTSDDDSNPRHYKTCFADPPRRPPLTITHHIGREHSIDDSIDFENVHLRVDNIAKTSSKASVATIDNYGVP